MKGGRRWYGVLHKTVQGGWGRQFGKLKSFFVSKVSVNSQSYFIVFELNLLYCMATVIIERSLSLVWRITQMVWGTDVSLANWRDRSTRLCVSSQSYFIALYINKPIKVEQFTPLSRDEVYER